MLTNIVKAIRKPTERQAIAGNYRKAHVRLHGLDITIENRRGTRRKPEWPILAAHYGYIKRTKGVDGDHVDVYLGPSSRSELVVVIDQKNQKGGFDEHKTMLGFQSEAAAVDAYQKCYSPGWKIGKVTTMTIKQFKAWLEDGSQMQPISDQVSQYAAKGESPHRWVTTETGSHILIASDGTVKSGAGGKLNGKKLSKVSKDPKPKLKATGNSNTSPVQRDTRLSTGRGIEPAKSSFAQSTLEAIKQHESERPELERQEAEKQKQSESHPHHLSQLSEGMKQALLDWHHQANSLVRPVEQAAGAAKLSGDDHKKRMREHWDGFSRETPQSPEMAALRRQFGHAPVMHVEPGVDKSRISELTSQLSQLLKDYKQQGINVAPFVKHNNLVPRVLAAKLKPNDKLFDPVQDHERFTAAFSDAFIEQYAARKSKNSPGQLGLFGDGLGGNKPLRNPETQTRWITIQGSHVMVDSKGTIVGGADGKLNGRSVRPKAKTQPTETESPASDVKAKAAAARAKIKAAGLEPFKPEAKEPERKTKAPRSPMLDGGPDSPKNQDLTPEEVKEHEEKSNEAHKQRVRDLIDKHQAPGIVHPDSKTRIESAEDYLKNGGKPRYRGEDTDIEGGLKDIPTLEKRVHRTNAITGRQTKYLVPPAEAKQEPSKNESPTPGIQESTLANADVKSGDQPALFEGEAKRAAKPKFEAKDMGSTKQPGMFGNLNVHPDQISMFDEAGAPDDRVYKPQTANEERVEASKKKDDAVADESPKEGDQNAEGLFLRNGRWRREGDPTYGDIVKTPDGIVGRMRSSGGMGSNRTTVIDTKGNPHWTDRDKLEHATLDDLNGIGEEHYPEFPRKAGEVLPDPKAAKPASGYKPPTTRAEADKLIAEYNRGTVKVGDAIEIGGNNQPVVSRVNKNTVSTEGGGIWKHGEYSIPGSTPAKVREFHEVGGVAAALERQAEAKKSAKERLSKSGRNPIESVVSGGGLKQILGAKSEHLAGIAEQLAGSMPGHDRASIRQALVDYRAVNGVTENEREKGKISIAAHSATPSLDELEHAFEHLVDRGGGMYSLRDPKNPDKVIPYANFESKNQAINYFVNHVRADITGANMYSPGGKFVKVSGRVASWLKSHGTSEAAMLGIDPKTIKKQAEAKIASAAMKISDYESLMRKIDSGTATADELREGYKQFKASEDGIRAELGKMKKEDIEGYTHQEGMRRMTAGGLTKPKAIESTLRRMEEEFHVSPGGLSYNIYGGGKGDARAEAIKAKIDATTDDHIAEHAAKFAANRKEMEDRRNARIDAFKNPKTAQEWAEKSKHIGYDKLTPEEQVKHDDAIARDRRERNPSRKQATEVTGFDAGSEATGNVGIVTGHHQKRGVPTYTVTVENHLGDNWNEALSRAKQMGGNYVNARIAKAYGATPGFQFFDENKAKAFSKVLGGESHDISEEVKARQEEKRQRQTESLTERAESILDRGEAKLNQPRKDNTARRARMAASSEADAQKSIAMAKTMQTLASKIEKGEVTHLAGVKAASHVDELDSQLRRAKWNAISEAQAVERATGKGPSYQEREDRHNNPPRAEDIAHAEFPYPQLHSSDMKRAADAMSSIPGLKRLAAKVSKWHTESKGDAWKQIRNSDDIEALKTSIPKLKRHPDHKVRHIAESLASKFENFNRLHSMDIKTTPELRAALREYHNLKSNPEGPDPVKEAERKLKRMKIAGFFPTPKTLGQKMLDHADIQEGHSVLEPSAGAGHLMDMVKEQHPDAKLHGIEKDFEISKLLKLKGHQHDRGDFLDHTKTYDRIVMNPPFENRQDEKHVKHAFGLLNPGGRIVAIMGAGAHSNERSAGFRDWLSSVGGKVVDVPEGSFNTNEAFKKTGVNTKMVIIDKPDSAEKYQSFDEWNDARESDYWFSVAEKYRAAAETKNGRKIITGNEGDRGYFVTIDSHPVFVKANGTIERGPKHLRGQDIKKTPGKKLARSNRIKTEAKKGERDSPGQRGIFGNGIGGDLLRKPETQTKAKLTDSPVPFKPKTKIDKMITDEVGYDPDDVAHFRDIYNDSHKMLSTEIRERNDALSQLLGNFGFGGSRIGMHQVLKKFKRAEEPGDIPRIDEMAMMARRSYPELLHTGSGHSDKSGDDEEALLNRLKIGFEKVPTADDERVLDLAKQMFDMHKSFGPMADIDMGDEWGEQSAPTYDDDFVPFAARFAESFIERYAASTNRYSMITRMIADRFRSYEMN